MFAVGSAVGCGSKHDKSLDKDAKTPQKAPPQQTIDTKLGNATYRDSNNQKLWTVYWELGAFTGAQGSPSSTTADMTGVHGQIYKANQTACTFKSRHATADEKTKILILSNMVEIDSVSPAYKLTCDRVVYDGKRKIIEAEGHVRVVGAFSSVGTLDGPLWTTPDFKKFGSPEAFNKP